MNVFSHYSSKHSLVQNIDMNLNNLILKVPSFVFSYSKLYFSVSIKLDFTQSAHLVHVSQPEELAQQDIISLLGSFFSYCSCICMMSSAINGSIWEVRSNLGLQNGGDGGTTAAQLSRGLVVLKGGTGDWGESQRWSSHSRYVIETARFLMACRFSKKIWTHICASLIYCDIQKKKYEKKQKFKSLNSQRILKYKFKMMQKN